MAHIRAYVVVLRPRNCRFFLARADNSAKAPRSAVVHNQRRGMRRAPQERRKGNPMQRIASLLITAALVACASGGQQPGPTRKDTQVTTVRARVSAVDQQKRLVTLVTPDGKQMTLQADAAVKNLPQVKVGDDVVGQLVQQLAIEVRAATPEEMAAPATVAEAVAVADPGEKPAGRYVRQVQAVLTVDAIDKQAGTVTVHGADGEPFVAKARDPKNLERMKVGDTVVVTYTEALTLAVVAPGT
jgi:hypothetical protein